MIDRLIEIDTNAFLYLNSMHNLFWDVVMKLSSGKIIWVGLYLAILYAIWKGYGWKVAAITLAGAALTVLLADQITASLIRPYFTRFRPAHIESPISEFVHIVDGYRGGRYGFPSCHASNTFAIATLMSLIFRRKAFALFMFFWALLNCYSRIYLGLHYTGDILVGLILGILIGLAVYFLVGMTLKKMNLIKLHQNGNERTALRIGSRDIHYYPSDIPVAVGLLTVAFIIIFAACLVF